jgi:hypothetical protein
MRREERLRLEATTFNQITCAVGGRVTHTHSENTKSENTRGASFRIFQAAESKTRSAGFCAGSGAWTLGAEGHPCRPARSGLNPE